MTEPVVVALVGLAIVDWVTAVILLRARFRHPGITALDERAFAATILAGVATLGAVLVISRLGHIVLPSDVGILIAATATTLASVPALWWLFLYLAGRFGRE